MSMLNNYFFYKVPFTCIMSGKAKHFWDLDHHSSSNNLLIKFRIGLSGSRS